MAGQHSVNSFDTAPEPDYCEIFKSRLPRPRRACGDLSKFIAVCEAILEGLNLAWHFPIRAFPMGEAKTDSATLYKVVLEHYRREYERSKKRLRLRAFGSFCASVVWGAIHSFERGVADVDRWTYPSTIDLMRSMRETGSDSPFLDARHKIEQSIEALKSLRGWLPFDVRSLNESQQRIFDLLKYSILTAKEIAAKLREMGDDRDAVAVKKCIHRMIENGAPIANDENGAGFYRTDALPPGSIARSA